MNKDGLLNMERAGLSGILAVDSIDGGNGGDVGDIICDCGGERDFE